MLRNKTYHIPEYQFHYTNNFKDMEKSIICDACIYVPLVLQKFS